MGRKDLMTTDITSDDADQEMVDVDPATGSHLASGAKRKGRSVSHGAKKRAHPPPSPRTSSAGAKARSPPAKKIASSNKMPRSASPQPKSEGKVAGKPPVKPPPKAITPLNALAVAKPPPKSVTAAAAAAEKEAKAKAAAAEKQAKARAEKEAKAVADWEKARETVAERESAMQQLLHSHHRCSPQIGQRSPLVRSSSGRQLRLTASIRTVQKDSITTLHPTTTSAATGVSLTPSLTHR